ncbi:hypothetical protein [Streptomyces sp. NPDC057686]|uniref:hypothetical protein n=1 Tax=Streptomyces sp. NPDC057686 TaxID=3346212 RepID=UPI0036978FCA
MTDAILRALLQCAAGRDRLAVLVGRVIVQAMLPAVFRIHPRTSAYDRRPHPRRRRSRAGDHPLRSGPRRAASRRSACQKTSTGPARGEYLYRDLASRIGLMRVLIPRDRAIEHFIHTTPSQHAAA